MNVTELRSSLNEGERDISMHPHWGPLGSRLMRGPLGSLFAHRVETFTREMAANYPARLRDALRGISPQTQISEESPVFILSAGWRSGSTLLQRMVMENNGDMIMWGEPFAHANIFTNMANQFRGFTREWPPKDFFFATHERTHLSNEWVANLYPALDSLLHAHRQFFDQLFGESARQLGWKTWGLKEVRLNEDHAAYLRMLYPNCKLLFLCRNPKEAYRSYLGWRDPAHREWPGRPIIGPYAFGRNWAAMTQGFMAEHKRLNALFVRYEDLDDPAEIARIEAYLGWMVSRSSGLRRVGTNSEGMAARLTMAERAALHFAAGKAARDAGY
jgi:hypothetical protein